MASFSAERPESHRHVKARWVDRMFLAHPRSVGETYGQHAAVAGRFGVAMIIGGVRCLVHAVVPGVQQRSASDAVQSLHRELSERQKAAGADCDYVI